MESALTLSLRAAKLAYLMLQKDGEGLNIIPESGQACLPDAPEGWRVPHIIPKSGQTCLPDAPEGWRVPQHYP